MFLCLQLFAIFSFIVQADGCNYPPQKKNQSIAQLLILSIFCLLLRFHFVDLHVFFFFHNHWCFFLSQNDFNSSLSSSPDTYSILDPPKLIPSQTQMVPCASLSSVKVTLTP